MRPSVLNMEPLHTVWALWFAFTSLSGMRAAPTHIYVIEVSAPSAPASVNPVEIARKFSRNLLLPNSITVKIAGSSPPEQECQADTPCDIITLRGEHSSQSIRVSLLVRSHPIKIEHEDVVREFSCSVSASGEAQWRMCLASKKRIESNARKIQEHVQWHAITR